MAGEACGPVASTWFGPGVWPTCRCGFDPRDNSALVRHWRDAGFRVVDERGRLVMIPGDRTTERAEVQ